MVMLIAKVFTLDAYTGVQMLSLWLVSVRFLRGVGRLQERSAEVLEERRRRLLRQTSSETKKTK